MPVVEGRRDPLDQLAFMLRARSGILTSSELRGPRVAATPCDSGPTRSPTGTSRLGGVVPCRRTKRADCRVSWPRLSCPFVGSAAGCRGGRRWAPGRACRACGFHGYEGGRFLGRVAGSCSQDARAHPRISEGRGRCLGRPQAAGHGPAPLVNCVSQLRLSERGRDGQPPSRPHLSKSAGFARWSHTDVLEASIHAGRCISPSS